MCLGINNLIMVLVWKLNRCGVMKKIFIPLVLTFAIFCFSCTLTSVYACIQDSAGYITGGACSIKELQNLEKNKSEQNKYQFQKKNGIDFAPNMRPSQIQSIDSFNCLFGMCLYRKILETQSK